MDRDEGKEKEFRCLVAQIEAQIQQARTTCRTAEQKRHAVVRLRTQLATLRETIPVPEPPSAPLPPQRPVPPVEPPPLPRLPTIRNDETEEITRSTDAAVKEKLRQIDATSLNRTRKRLNVEVASLKRGLEEKLRAIAVRALPDAQADAYRRHFAMVTAYKVANEAFFQAEKDYPTRFAAYREKIAIWDRVHAAAARKYGLYERIVLRLERDVDALDRWLNPTVVPWHFLPPGEREAALIALIGCEQRKNPTRSCDIERVNFALSLGPTEVVIGSLEFDGYYAFLFKDTKHVLLENPWEGNAAFVFFEDWKRLAQMSKKELLSNEHGRFRRVIHRVDSDWKHRIRRALRDDRSNQS